MGWWSIGGKKQVTGDGPLDLVEDYLSGMVDEYEEAFRRKPTLKELLAPLEAVLSTRAEEYMAGGDRVVVQVLKAKTRPRPKKYRARIGDVFAVPLGRGRYAFGRQTPQREYLEYYVDASKTVPSVKQLRAMKRIRPDILTPMDPIEERRWKLVAHVPYDDEAFVPMMYLVGDYVGCSTKPGKDGFIDPSAQLRRATAEEGASLPPLAIDCESGIIDMLKARTRRKKNR